MEGKVLCVCVRAYVRACVRVCVCACMYVCADVNAHMHGYVHISVLCILLLRSRWSYTVRMRLLTSLSVLRVTCLCFICVCELWFLSFLYFFAPICFSFLCTYIYNSVLQM